MKQKISILFPKSAVLLLLLPMAAAISYGQTPTATLSGVVHTMQSEVLKDATVTATNNATGKARQVKTDKDGRYVFALLDPGSYDLQVQASGFKLLIQKNLILNVGGATVNDVQMEVGGISDQVTIEVQNPMTESNKTDVSRVVTENEIQGLPNIGRNFVDFVKLSSGVSVGREAVYGGPFKEPDVGVGAVAAPRLSFSGQSELSTLIQVDGADNVQTFTGLPRATPSQEAASEFRVLNSTYLAEYGRASAGFVNIITRSGGNNINGSAYYFGENDALNARSILDAPGANALRQNQFGATIGGPIQKDKTFYFINYEGQRRDESNRFAQVVQQNIAGLNTFRASFNLAPETLNLPRSNNYDQGLVKVDRVIGSSELSLRYNNLVADTANFLGGGSLAAPTSSTARNNHVNDQSVVVSYVSSLSTRASNEARVQLARRIFDFPTVLNEPTIEVSNLLTMGKNPADLDYYREDRIQASDNFSYIIGAHQLKFGGDYNYLRDFSMWELFFPARIIFPSVARLVNFTPTTVPSPTTGPVAFIYPLLYGMVGGYQVPVPFTQAVPTAYFPNCTRFSLDHSEIGGFAQDQWKVTPKVSLTLGLRYDFEGYPSRYVVNPDYNNFQPRIGIAYNWNSKGVVRAGFGIFNDRLATSIGQSFNAVEYNNRGNLPNASVLFPGVATFNGRFTQIMVGGPPAAAAALQFLSTGQTPAAGMPNLNDTLDGNMATPYSEQASLQLSQELPGGFTVTAGYLYVHGAQLLGRTGNLNAVATPAPATLPPTMAPAPGQPYYGARMFPELGNIFILTNAGDSVYHGGTLEVERRFGIGMDVHGSYTFSRTISDGAVDSLASLNDFPEAPGVSDRGLSRQHIANRLAISLLEQVPDGVFLLQDFQFSSMVAVESGRPFSLFTGYDANNDGNPLSDRPGTLGRNTLIGPGFGTVDMRVSRPVKFSDRLSGVFSIDFFNLLNRVNIRSITTFYGSSNLNTPPVAGFGAPRDVANPRQLQFGMKLKF
ncbi:MAG: TonB-dependent receptor [Chloracidobacterium sp.]|nr:TonB-dependent receptor [Chloracidobacterium sp.]